MKKFINHPEHVVEEMLQGLSLLHPGSVRLSGHKVLLRADAEQVRHRQVAVISGGGSGHEPAHAGYIGAGMLSAAVAGEVFTSPSSDSIFAAITAVAGKPGALLIVKNYTGDRMNFGVAAEMARAEGIPVDTVIVNDDVALKAMEQAMGARGLSGTVLIHKLLGAAAAQGKSLADLAVTCKAAIQSLATMGISLSAGTSPAVGRASFELAEDEIEVGLGIHGEPGVQRMKLQGANELTEMLLREILKYGKFGDKKRIAVMVNNLGASTEMELAIVARHAVPFLESKGFTVERIYAGTFLSSLDMAGISISLLGVNDEWLEWLDATTTAPAWPNAPKRRPGKPEAQTMADVAVKVRPPISEHTPTEAGRRTKRAIEAACNALIDAETKLTELDRLTGDGDLGLSMKRAAVAVQNMVSMHLMGSAPAALKALGHILQREMGGSSGPLYGVLALRCASTLENSMATGITQWVEGIDQGCQALSALGGAKPGDRTMLDALDPFVQSLKNGRGELSRDVVLKSVEAAERGAHATAQMRPRLGRSSYLGDRVLGHPDPGATAVAIWLRAACESLFPL